jgi:hypothetical protein
LKDSENGYLWDEFDTDSEGWGENLYIVLKRAPINLLDPDDIDELLAYLREHAEDTAQCIVEDADNALKIYSIEEFANENFSGNVDLENETSHLYVSRLMDLFRAYHYNVGDWVYWCDADDIPTTNDALELALEPDEKALREFRGLEV